MRKKKMRDNPPLSSYTSAEVESVKKRLIEAGQAYYKALGESPRRKDWPHSDQALRVFGFWNDFLAAAGLPLSKITGRPRTTVAGSKMASFKTDAEVEEEKQGFINKILQKFIENGFLPPKTEMAEEFNVERIVFLFGSWSFFLQKANIPLTKIKGKHEDEEIFMLGVKLLEEKRAVVKKGGSWYRHIDKNYSFSYRKAQYAMKIARTVIQKGLSPGDARKNVVI